MLVTLDSAILGYNVHVTSDHSVGIHCVCMVRYEHRYHLDTHVCVYSPVCRYSRT